MAPRLMFQLAVVAGLLMVLAGCGAEGDGGETTAEDDQQTEETDDGDGGDDGDSDAPSAIAEHCPDPIVLQANWLPQPAHYPVYQFAGTGGEINADDGVYTNHRDDLGVDVEVRMGGPKVGFQPTQSVLYQDQDILLAMLVTTDIMGSIDQQPTMGVLTYQEKSPISLMFDPATYDFETMEDIRDSGATVIHREGASYIDYLVGAGLLDEEQTDASYDGSPSRFIASEGEIVQQAFATSEPYVMEEELQEWGKPVDYILAADAGYESYYHLVVREDTMQQQQECLEHLVPEIQQAMVDYLDDPEPVNQELLAIADELGDAWPLTQERIDYALSIHEEEEIIDTGDDDVWGNHDMDKMQRILDNLGPTIEETAGVDLSDVTVDGLATNQFIDDSVTE